MRRLSGIAALLFTAGIACGLARTGASSPAAANGSAPPPPASTPDAGSSPAGSPDSGNGAGPASASYHLIDIGHAGFGVATVSRGGKVLLWNGYMDPKRFVFDVATGVM